MRADMDQNEPSLQELATKIDAMAQTVEKLRRYFQITMWVTIIFLVVPIIGMMFVMPMFMSSYVGSLDSSDLEAQLNALQGL